MAYNSVQYLQQPLVNDTPQTFAIDGNSLQYGRHKISVRLIDSIGDPVTTGISGTISLSVRGFGADTFDASSASLALTSGERTFVPILDNIDAVQLEASGLSAGHSAIATITSSGSDV